MVFGWFKKKKKAKKGQGAKKWDMTKTLQEAQKKNKKTNAKKPVKKPCAKCEAKAQEIKLVEFVEVVTRDKEVSVTGPGKAASKKFTKTFSRTEKDGGAYKQYVNLDKDLDGASAKGTDATKRRPDFGQYVELRARVEWVRGDKKRSLAGKTVYFSSKLNKGKDSRPASMTGDEDHGFASAGGVKEKYAATTDKEGWTAPVKFYLSRYGGDKFQLTAQADEKNKSKPSGKKINIGKFVTWRKFWYQTSRYGGAKLPNPAKAVACYKEVCAEMVGGARQDVVYTKAKLDEKEAGISDHTLYAEHMCIPGKSGNGNRVIIGRHNEKAIRKFLVDSATEPIKMHFMYCDCQWDPSGWSSAISKDVPHGAKSVKTAASGACVKPALKGDLLKSAKWYALDASGNPNGHEGNMDDSYVTIPTNRGWQLNELTLTVPDDVVSQSTGGGIRLEFKIAVAGTYLGDSDGYQITVAADRPDDPVNATIAHEAGHAFWQAPHYPNDAANLPKSFNNAEKGKLKVYPDAGYHCSFKAKKYGAIYQQGVCTMATRSNKNKGRYCKLCKPFVRLQDMSQATVKKPKR